MAHPKKLHLKWIFANFIPDFNEKNFNKLETVYQKYSTLIFFLLQLHRLLKCDGSRIGMWTVFLQQGHLLHRASVRLRPGAGGAVGLLLEHPHYHGHGRPGQTSHFSLHCKSIRFYTHYILNGPIDWNHSLLYSACILSCSTTYRCRSTPFWVRNTETPRAEKMLNEP